jgi:hypothetical protein
MTDAMDPATKQDLEDVERRLETKLDQIKLWMLNREVQAIRWFVGTQLAYVVIVIGAVYFIVGHVLPAPPPAPIVIQLPAAPK